MKSKQIITVLLLVFVVGTVTATFYKEFLSNSVETTSEEITQPSGEKPARQIIVYYFFGNQRCTTCRNIEAYTIESLKTHFQDELDLNLVVWKPVNIELSENEHFIEDFKLDMKLVVLADVKDDEQVKWKKLEQVWPLAGNQEAFIEYVKKETETYLKEV